MPGERDSDDNSNRKVESQSDSNNFARPASREDFATAARDQLADMNRKIEGTNVSDSNAGRINAQLHGDEKSVMINRYVDLLGTCGADKLPGVLEGKGAAKEYHDYKNKILNNVFEKDGRTVKESATIKDMRMLLDLNNAEISAMDHRKVSAGSNLNKVETMKEFGDRYAPPSGARPRDQRNSPNAPSEGSSTRDAPKPVPPEPDSPKSKGPDGKEIKPIRDAGTPGEKKFN